MRKQRGAGHLYPQDANANAHAHAYSCAVDEARIHMQVRERTSSFAPELISPWRSYSLARA
eukprot:1534564-Pleurochrysis_carterae.AAC.3